MSELEIDDVYARVGQPRLVQGVDQRLPVLGRGLPGQPAAGRDLRGTGMIRPGRPAALQAFSTASASVTLAKEMTSAGALTRIRA